MAKKSKNTSGSGSGSGSDEEFDQFKEEVAAEDVAPIGSSSQNYAVAAFVALICTYLLRAVLGLSQTADAILLAISWAFSTFVLQYAYTSYAKSTYYDSIAARAQATPGKAGKASSSQATVKELTGAEATAYAYAYINSLFILSVVFCGFVLFASFGSSFNALVSLALSAVVVVVATTNAAKAK